MGENIVHFSQARTCSSSILLTVLRPETLRSQWTGALSTGSDLERDLGVLHSCIHLFLQSFHNFLLWAYYVIGLVLGPTNTAVDKIVSLSL